MGPCEQREADTGLLSRVQSTHSTSTSISSNLQCRHFEAYTSKLLNEYNSKFSENVYIKNDKLYYKPLNLQIVPKDDEDRKQTILKKHFHGPANRILYMILEG